MSDMTAVQHKRGGLYFEGFVVGTVVEHRYRRTVTQSDNMLFSNMTLAAQPLHIDRHFCEQETEWGKPLMNSFFTLGLMIGISVSDLSVGTTIADLICQKSNSRIRYSMATQSIAPPRSLASTSPTHDPVLELSSFFTGPTTRTTN